MTARDWETLRNVASNKIPRQAYNMGYNAALEDIKQMIEAGNHIEYIYSTIDDLKKDED